MLKQADIANIIKTIPWFFDLSPESCQRLTAIGDIQTFGADHVIFTEGEQHPYLYIILEGRILLESYIPGHGTLPIFTAETLDVIGWSSLTPVVRQKTGTARVLETTQVLSFNANDLMELCEQDCDLGFVVMRRLANIVASRLLTHRLHLLGLLTHQGD